MKKLFIIPLLLSAFIAHAASTASAALSWTAPTVFTDGTPISGVITYNVYQGLAGALVKVQSGVTTTAATITAGLTPNTTQCFAVTAVVNAEEGAQSTASCAAIPAPTPGAPTGVIIVITGTP